MKEPRSPVTPTALHSAEKEKRAIALRRLALSPCAARDLAPLLPPTVGEKSRRPEVRRREVAEAGRYLERRRIHGLPVYAVWTHAVNGKGRRLSDSTPGVRRVTLSSVSCAADWTIVLAEARAMRGERLSENQRRADGMAVYDVEDEDNG